MGTGGEGNMGKWDMEQGDMRKLLTCRGQPGRKGTCSAPLLGPGA